MEVRDKVTVQEWDEPALPRQDFQPQATVTWKSPTLIGVLGTLTFHLVLVASLGVSFGGRPSAPNKPDLNRIAGVGPLDSLILVSLSAIPRSRELNIDLRPPSKVLDDAPLVLKPPPSVNTERLALKNEPSSAENAELSQAAEIYDRQIRARIERIWQRPQIRSATSTSEGASSEVDREFQCQAQLEQDERGNVVEVLLPVCNGSSEWRESLL